MWYKCSLFNYLSQITVISVNLYTYIANFYFSHEVSENHDRLYDSILYISCSFACLCLDMTVQQFHIYLRGELICHLESYCCRLSAQLWGRLHKLTGLARSLPGYQFESGFTWSEPARDTRACFGATLLLARLAGLAR